AGIVAELELEQGAVPPEMVLQVVAAFPVRRERGEPLDAFAAAALHLHHMSDGVRGPEIAGVELDGAAPGWLGGEIVAGPLVGEGMAGEYRCIAWDVLRPGRDHALNGANHVLRAAEPEIGEMGETESDHIERMGAQNRFPQDDGTIELAFGPGGQGGDVVVLARGGAGGKRLCGARRLDGSRNGGLLIGQPGEIALHAMSEREVGMGLQEGGETGGRIGSLGEVAGDDIVVGSGSLGAGGRDGEAAGIEMHGAAPSRHLPIPDSFEHLGGMTNSKLSRVDRQRGQVTPNLQMWFRSAQHLGERFWLHTADRKTSPFSSEKALL